MVTADPRPPSRLLAWLQLMRLPNVFTAMADVLMGFLFTHKTLSPFWVFVVLLESSSFLYVGGMILNDVFDVEQDQRERPQRPIPSGRVKRESASTVGWRLIWGGIGLGWMAGIWAASFPIPGIIATALAATIVAYNREAKRMAVGPIFMGTCRFLNVLLGMSASPVPWSPANWIVAGGIGLYIVGVTWFARREAATSERWQLSMGTLIAAAGMLMLVAAPLMFPDEWPVIASFFLHPKNWLILWGAIIGLIGWRFVQALAKPEPALVQAAVKTGILGIIVLDAGVVYGVHGVGAAVGVLLLLAPAILLGRWVYST